MHHILKDDLQRAMYRSSVDRPKPFLEPTLVRRPAVYADFLRHMHQAGMLGWREGGESLMGVFFVPKKSGKLHIILDTRDVNNLITTPQY